MRPKSLRERSLNAIFFISFAVAFVVAIPFALLWSLIMMPIWIAQLVRLTRYLAEQGSRWVPLVEIDGHFKLSERGLWSMIQTALMAEAVRARVSEQSLEGCPEELVEHVRRAKSPTRKQFRYWDYQLVIGGGRRARFSGMIYRHARAAIP